MLYGILFFKTGHVFVIWRISVEFYKAQRGEDRYYIWKIKKPTGKTEKWNKMVYYTALLC